MTNRVTLKPGDYVSTEGMKEEQYHAVARAFMEAGADEGGFDDDEPVPSCWHLFGWGEAGGQLAFWDKEKSYGENCRHLTIHQVLNATNAGGHAPAKRYRAVNSPFFTDGSIVELDVYKTDSSSLFRLISGHCKYENASGRRPGAWDSFRNMEPVDMPDTLTTTLEQAAEHGAKAMHHAAEHERLMQQAREMMPDGWMLVRGGVDWAEGQDMSDPANWREGDVLECISTKGRWVSEEKGMYVGRLITLSRDFDPHQGALGITAHSCRYHLEHKCFRFHHRPT